MVNPDDSRGHLQRLATAGLDIPAAAARGQFELRSNTDTYLENGRFSPDRMLAVFEQLASGHARHGFGQSRIVCRMDWAAGSPRLMDDVIEFESRVNDLWRVHQDAVICTYRLEQFGGDAIMDILRSHPAVILGGILQRNPFFVPPEQFLPELRERRAQRRTARGVV